MRLSFSFFIDPAPTATFTLSLHDALPICGDSRVEGGDASAGHRGPQPCRRTGGSRRAARVRRDRRGSRWPDRRGASRSEEHTSELQSPCNLVCRLLLEKKKQTERTLVFCT